MFLLGCHLCASVEYLDLSLPVSHDLVLWKHCRGHLCRSVGTRHKLCELYDPKSMHWGIHLGSSGKLHLTSGPHFEYVCFGLESSPHPRVCMGTLAPFSQNRRFTCGDWVDKGWLRVERESFLDNPCVVSIRWKKVAPLLPFLDVDVWFFTLWAWDLLILLQLVDVTWLQLAKSETLHILCEKNTFWFFFEAELLLNSLCIICFFRWKGLSLIPSLKCKLPPPPHYQNPTSLNTLSVEWWLRAPLRVEKIQLVTSHCLISYRLALICSTSLDVWPSILKPAQLLRSHNSASSRNQTQIA